MNPQRFQRLLAAALLAVASAGWAAPANSKEVSFMASAVLSELKSGAVKRAWPAFTSRKTGTSSASPTIDDHAKIASGVAVVMKTVGTLSAARPVGNVSFYELQITGADVPYWESVPNRGIDSRVTYAVNFSKIGPGIVSFTFTRLSEKWKLRSISFGLEPTVPQSREKAMQIARGFLQTMVPGIDEVHLDQVAAQMLGLE